MSAANSAYQQSLQYLYEHLPQFSQLGKAALKHKLDNIIELTDRLGNPHLKYKTIHIAGTNGKGSTSHMLCAALMQAGYKVGMYTSPHLVDFRERIRINGAPVAEEWVVQFVAQHKSMMEDIHPSFFEATVTMAFQAFADHHVDVAVIETGLGGRLDSTNIVLPELCIITNISYDHKDVLGDTLPKIAAEKAGIFKPDIPVVIGDANEEIEQVFFEKALHTRSTLYYARNHWEVVTTSGNPFLQAGKVVHLADQKLYDFECGLHGHYQRDNIRTVLTSVSVLQSLGWSVTVDDALAGIKNVKQLTGIRGRWERLSDKPLIIADVAHNPAGIAEVFEQWKQVAANTKVILVGFVKDKDVEQALSLFPKEQTIICCQAQIARALSSQLLTEKANEKGLKSLDGGSVESALEKAKAILTEQDALLILGSFFVVGEVLNLFQASAVGST